jgi:pimeloyl-ACP methyl ester carboxylesterase
VPWPIRLLGALALALALAGPAAAAPAAEDARFGRCAEDVVPPFLPARCGGVGVPLDRTGAVPGRVRLEVARVLPFRGRARGALFALAGGPGQAAVPLTLDFLSVLEPALGRRQLVVFDQRGTGSSGVLRCREIERARDVFSAAPAAERCAERLGPRRAFYTTRDSVEDLEAVRSAIGVERISIYGVSYGSKLAVAYAQRYPEHVERLVLDSVLAPDGPDPFYRDSLVGSARVLRELCPAGCGAITPDPVADLRELVVRAAGGALQGAWYDGRGHRRPLGVDGFDVASVLIAGDFDSGYRDAFPAAARSALRGDLAPLTRLVHHAIRTENDIGDDPRLFSPALYVATTCEETPLPWDRAAPFDAREAQARAAADALPESDLGPFDRATALGSDLLATCARWFAASPPPEPASGPLPAVPTLILEGAADLRTPLEGATRLAARIPGASVVTVEGAGHSVLGADASGCSGRTLARFFRGRPLPPLCPSRERASLLPLAPLSLDEVRARGGRPGRTAAAAAATLLDVSFDAGRVLLSGADRVLRGGGLRGGRYSAAGQRLRLRRVEYVPGVELSGTVDLSDGSGRLRVSGRAAARGSLRLEDERLTGRLGGRRVRARVNERSFARARFGLRSGRRGGTRPLSAFTPQRGENRSSAYPVGSGRAGRVRRLRQQ